MIQTFATLLVFQTLGESLAYILSLLFIPAGVGICDVLRAQGSSFKAAPQSSSMLLRFR